MDFDVVEPANLACQGYFEADLGQAKVEATAALARRINSQVEIHTVNERFRRSMEIGNVLFVCVDKIDTTTAIKVTRMAWHICTDQRHYLPKSPPTSTHS